MHALALLPLLLTGSGAPIPVTPADFPKIEQQLVETVETGSLIFSQGDCLAVKVFSASSYTHVGIVSRVAGSPVVYDSMSGIGVRKMPLHEYLRLQTPCTLKVVHPQDSFSSEEARALRAYLESQLGREYGIKHHLTGSTAEGIHCAEYATHAWMSAGRLKADRPSRVSPGSLLTGVEEKGAVRSGGTYLLSPAPIAEEVPSGWWHRLWIETRDCTTESCQQMRRWFVCS